MKGKADTTMVTPTLIWPDFTSENAAMLTGRARRRFNRAREEELPDRSSLELAARALDVPVWPAAALVRLAQGRKPGEDEYLAEPVMLRPDRDRLSLHRLGEEALDEREERELVQAAHAHFPEDELRIAIEEGVWFARLPGREAKQGVAVEQAQEMLLNPLPEQFGVDVAGMRVLNELQMLWYSHPVNEARRRQGRAEVNALWVWGGGRLPETAPQAVGLKAIAADEPALEGLAKWMGLPLESAHVMRERTDFEDCLVVIASGEVEPGLQWLKRFLGRRREFRLLASGSAWSVPARSLLRRW